MIDLITLEEAKAHLRETGSNADADIEQKIFTASAILFDYLKIDPDASPLSVPWGIENETPGVIKAAVCLMVGELYRNREAKDSDVLSDHVKRLLHRRRDPALA